MRIDLYAGAACVAVAVVFGGCSRRSGTEVTPVIPDAAPAKPKLAIAEAAQPGPPAPRHVLELVAGQRHTCALLEGGEVRCWGEGDAGELGDGTRKAHPRPTTVPSLGSVKQLAAGAARTCALVSDGTIRCWGTLARRPRLHLDAGAGPDADKTWLVPTLVPNIAHASDLAIAPYDSLGCAVVNGGRLSCWGEPAPVIAPTMDDVSVVRIGESTNAASGCALRRSGAVACWGNNDWGQLGDGTTKSRATLAPVEGITDAISLAVGGGRACAVHRAGTVSCWGGVVRDRSVTETCDVPNLGPRACSPRPRLFAGASDAASVMVTDILTAVLRRDATISFVTIDPTLPRSPATLDTFVHPGVALSVGSGVSCIARRDDVVQCAGQAGLLGDGKSAAPPRGEWAFVSW